MRLQTNRQQRPTHRPSAYRLPTPVLPDEVAQRRALVGCLGAGAGWARWELRCLGLVLYATSLLIHIYSHAQAAALLLLLPGSLLSRLTVQISEVSCRSAVESALTYPVESDERKDKGRSFKKTFHFEIKV